MRFTKHMLHWLHCLQKLKHPTTSPCSPPAETLKKVFPNDKKWLQERSSSTSSTQIFSHYERFYFLPNTMPRRIQKAILLYTYLKTCCFHGVKRLQISNISNWRELNKSEPSIHLTKFPFPFLGKSLFVQGENSTLS